jgi:hypothetical protein
MSKRWAEVFKTCAPVPEGSHWTYVADRESDFYEPIRHCRSRGVDFVIRACQNRRLAGQAGHLWESLEQATVLGQVAVELRSRPGQGARRAIVELRSQQVDLSGPWRPGGWQADLEGIWVVEAREKEPPAQTEPLHWILLSSLPSHDLTQARRIIGRYTARWHIEEYHKALKSGAGVEESQLSHQRSFRLEVPAMQRMSLRMFPSASLWPGPSLRDTQSKSKLNKLLLTEQLNK